MGKINLSGVDIPQRTRMAPAFKLSEQQQAIMDYVQAPVGNLIIQARAGTGKTSTLVEVCKVLESTAVFMAFNKAISVEIGRKLADAGITDREVKAATFHSVGFQAWIRHMPKSGKNVRGEKLDILAERMSIPWAYRTFCKKLVGLAKQTLIGVDLGDGMTQEIDDTHPWLALVEHHDLLADLPEQDEPISEEDFLEEALPWCVRLLQFSIQESDTMIDFDDMIYMPLYSKLRFWQYDWVLIDEAQDTNIARRVIASRLLRPGGRLIAVGDDRQAIYGFTGASHDALELIENEFQCEVLPLTVTYRCAKDIVKLAQRWVPDIEWRPDAPDGRVTSTSIHEFKKITPNPDDAILCRNMRPLVEIAFDYLRRHIGCHIEGQEIGASLVTLAKRWKTAATIHDLQLHLDEYLLKETEKLMAQHKYDKLGVITDKVSTLQVLAESLPASDPVESLTALINRLFKDSDGVAKRTVTLSTIHKAKGREWDRVFLLGRHKLMPSKYAKQEWQLLQEENLMYVAVTRAKNTLVDVVLPEGR